MDVPSQHQDRPAVLAGPLAWLTDSVLSRPRLVLGVGLLAATVCVALASMLLGFHASRLDLLSPHSAFNRRWLAYLDEFGDQDDIVILVDGPSEASVVAAMDELAESLRDEPAFSQLLYQSDLSAWRAKGLHFLAMEELQQLHAFLDEVDPVLRGDWGQLILAGSRQLSASSTATASQRVELLQQLNGALEEDEVAHAGPARLQRLREIEAQFAPRHLLMNEGRRGILLLRIAPKSRGDDAGAIERLRALVAEAGTRHTSVELGITGMPVLEHDEMAASQHDTLRASLLSLAGVACIFIAGFGGLRQPLLAVAALLIGIAWSMGYVTLAIGHLNILSVAFGAILIGLGVDFGIHYLARFLELRKQEGNSRAALIETARCVGPGIVTGGVTTSLAFLAAGVTEFKGVAELGLVAGGGVVFCVLSALVMLPAMLLLSDRAPTLPLGETHLLPFASLCRPACRHPWLVLLVTAAGTAGLGWGMTRLRYDHNLLNLQPLRQESVLVERKLASSSDRGVWFAVSMSPSREELVARKRRLEALPVVTATEDLASIFPAENRQREQLIARLRDRLAELPDMPPLIPVADRLQLTNAISQLTAASPSAYGRDTALLDKLQGLSEAEYFARVSGWQQAQAAKLLDALHQLRSMANPNPPSAADLPPEIAHRYIGRGGMHLLKVYGPRDLWDMDALDRFVRNVESVDPDITGHPIQTYYASRQMQRSYLNASVYALLAVGVVLMLDLRSVKYSLLAVLPMGLGVVQMLGLLGWLGIPLNPANMIVLPLVLGIGIDDGVHVVHDFLRRQGEYRLSNSTAAAVFLTSATTMIGFGSMMTASHRGLQSLGQVLTLGIFCCLVSSVLVLPAVLVRGRLLRA